MEGDEAVNTACKKMLGLIFKESRLGIEADPGWVPITVVGWAEGRELASIG